MNNPQVGGGHCVKRRGCRSRKTISSLVLSRKAEAWEGSSSKGSKRQPDPSLREQLDSGLWACFLSLLSAGTHPEQTCTLLFFLGDLNLVVPAEAKLLKPKKLRKESRGATWPKDTHQQGSPAPPDKHKERSSKHRKTAVPSPFPLPPPLPPSGSLIPGGWAQPFPKFILRAPGSHNGTCCGHGNITAQPTGKTKNINGEI